MARLILLLAGALLLVALVGGEAAPAKVVDPITCDDEGNCAPPPPPPPPPPPAPPPPPPPPPSPPPSSNPYWYPDGWYYESAGVGASSGFAASSLSSAGCEIKTVTKTAKSFLFRTVIFRLHLRVNWCWTYPSITSLAVNCWVSDVDRFTITHTSCKLNGWYYLWSGSSTGGRYQQGQATFSNCVVKYGCWRNDLVTLRFWANGNGAWRAET
jgi:hypothetical protein